MEADSTSRGLERDREHAERDVIGGQEHQERLDFKRLRTALEPTQPLLRDLRSAGHVRQSPVSCEAPALKQQGQDPWRIHGTRYLRPDPGTRAGGGNSGIDSSHRS